MKPDQQPRYCYRIYGLNLAVNRMLPGLAASDDTAPPDVTVHWTETVAEQLPVIPDRVLYAASGRTEQGESYLNVWRDEAHQLHLSHTNGGLRLHFTIASTGRGVQILAEKGMPIENIMAYFLGPVMGCLLRVRRVTCLHAGVFSIGEAAVAVIGSKQAGKSTTIAAFARDGYPVLTDDIAALKEQAGTCFVQPGYPRMRLWPDAVETVSGLTPGLLNRVEVISDKRYLDLTPDQTASEWRFQTKPQPLAAVYVLAYDESAPNCTVHPLSPREGLMALVGNTYADYLLDETGRRCDLDRLSDLAGRIPIKSLQRPVGLHHLPGLSRVVLDDLNSE